MAKEINLVVIASTDAAEDALDVDDRTVAGTYDVYLSGDTPADKLEAAALDAFHTSVAVAVLDDFEFSVRDTNDKIIEDAVESDSYTLDQFCLSVEKRHD